MLEFVESITNAVAEVIVLCLLELGDVIAQIRKPRK
jgi:hypothetical protein